MKLNPGSKAALDQGCQCAVVDNRYGLGYYAGREGVDFSINIDCPLHGVNGTEHLQSPANIRDTPHDWLHVGHERDEDGSDLAVLLYTPDMEDKGNHFHIALDITQAKTLFNWLSIFLAKAEDRAARQGKIP